MGVVCAASDLPDVIPSNMDELARYYYDFIRGMVRKQGIPDQEAGDAVQYILERLDKTGAIAQFDPESPDRAPGPPGPDEVLHVPRRQGHARTAAASAAGWPGGPGTSC